MQIESADDAKSMVRRYIVGTRSRHRKIASITVDEEAKCPDSEGLWTVTGNFVTEEGEKEKFAASVTSRGEVLMTQSAAHEVSEKGSRRQRK